MISLRAAPILAVLLLAACDTTPPPEKAKADAAPAKSGAAATTPENDKGGVVRASGSSALQPLVNAAKEKFETANKGVSVEVSAGGSKKGLADVASGAVQIGNSDVFASKDQADLKDHKVAVYAFAVMTNKGPFNEKVRSLTKEQMAKIFQGEIKNWKEVGGEAQAITVINRAPSSGTRTTFGNAILGGDKFVESQTEDNSGALVTKLKQTKGAVSYLATSFADPELITMSLKTPEGDVEATAENVTSGKYPIWSYGHMYTKGEPTGATKAFLDYVVSKDFQESVLPGVKGFIPVISMKVTRDKD